MLLLVKKSLDDEINQRVHEYKNGTMKTVPLVLDLIKLEKTRVSNLILEQSSRFEEEFEIIIDFIALDKCKSCFRIL